jgi:hypothetical protein
VLLLLLDPLICVPVFVTAVATVILFVAACSSFELLDLQGLFSDLLALICDR